MFIRYYTIIKNIIPALNTRLITVRASFFGLAEPVLLANRSSKSEGWSEDSRVILSDFALILSLSKGKGKIVSKDKTRLDESYFDGAQHDPHLRYRIFLR